MLPVFKGLKVQLEGGGEYLSSSESDAGGRGREIVKVW